MCKEWLVEADKVLAQVIWGVKDSDATFFAEGGVRAHGTGFDAHTNLILWVADPDIKPSDGSRLSTLKFRTDRFIWTVA